MTSTCSILVTLTTPCICSKNGACPCWIKDENGHNMNGAAAKAAGKSLRKGDEPVRSGRWQIMINGESCTSASWPKPPRMPWVKTASWSVSSS